MRQTQTRKLLDHWRELSRNGAPPDRNDLDPSAIAATLQDVFILGCGPDRLWRYRVAGTRLSAYADRDLRGELFTGWWRPQDRFDISRLVDGVAQDRSPLVGGVSALSTRQERHELEFILLPLRHGGQDGLRMAGAFFPGPYTGRLFDVRFDEMAIVSLRSLADARSPIPFARPAANAAEFAERRREWRVIEGGLS